MTLLKFMYMFTGLQAICRYVKSVYKSFLVGTMWVVLTIIVANLISLTFMRFHNSTLFSLFLKDMTSGVAFQHPGEFLLGLTMLTLAGIMMAFIAGFVIGIAFYAVCGLLILGALIWNAPREIEKWAIKCWNSTKGK